MVDAVDKQFIEIPKESTVNFFHMYIEDFDFPHQYDFILARNVLYFLDKESLLVVFERCKKTLEKRGVYYFSVLGVRDEWVIKKDFCFFNKMEIMHIFAEYTCMNVVENEGWGTTYSGSQKYWHTLSFVFKK